ncbi:MAG: recombinase RecT [Taibaiella sp.]|jgi:recombinational DNA repair protein RecT
METAINQNQQLSNLLNDPNIKGKDLISSPLVADRFEFLYKTVNGIKDDKVAHAYYETEKFYFLKRIAESKDLNLCTNLSLYGVFLDVAVNGLSFDPSMKHVYVYSRNVNVGTNDNKVWQKRAVMDISPYGELLLRQQQGQIKYADNPMLVYEGDHFVYGTKNGNTVVDHLVTLPRKSDHIIAGYVKLTRADGSYDFKLLSYEDTQRLRAASKDSNSVAWTTGFPGMVVAKVIKHAFKNFPKLRVGAFSQLQTEIIDQPEDIDYGIDVTDQASANNTNEQQNLAQGDQEYFNPSANFNANPQAAQQQQSTQTNQSTPEELDF